MTEKGTNYLRILPKCKKCGETIRDRYVWIGRVYVCFGICQNCVKLGDKVTGVVNAYTEVDNHAK